MTSVTVKSEKAMLSIAGHTNIRYGEINHEKAGIKRIAEEPTQKRKNISIDKNGVTWIYLFAVSRCIHIQEHQKWSIGNIHLGYLLIFNI